MARRFYNMWRFDVSNAAVLVPTYHVDPLTQEPTMTVDEDGQPVSETVYRDLTFFVRCGGFGTTQNVARAVFDGYTGRAYPDVIQTPSECSEEVWLEDWNSVGGTLIDIN